MRRSWRPLALAAAVNLTLGAGGTAAQTVIVRHAPSGSTIDLVFNDTSIATATADARGDARVTMNVQATAGKPEVDARAYLDVCDAARRVILVPSGGQPAPPEATCKRSDLLDLFLLQRVTTLVVNFAGANPVVRLRQGSPPREWLEEGEQGLAPRTWRPAPTGLSLFGGAGLTNNRNTVSLACGNLSDCSGDGTRGTFAFGGDIWVMRFLAAEVSYVKPGDMIASGTGSHYHFNTFLESEWATVAAKVAVPLGPVRPYGKIGANYHRATFNTTQVTDPLTVTVDDADQTLPGGTDTFETRNNGWSWMFGGGLEAWLTGHIAIFGELDRVAIKGKAIGADALFDDRMTVLLVGARVHVGK